MGSRDPRRAYYGLDRDGYELVRVKRAGCPEWLWAFVVYLWNFGFEAVESGITEFEDEFLAHIVLPDGSTVGAFMRPQIAKAYLVGKMPPMLPALPAHEDAS